VKVVEKLVRFQWFTHQTDMSLRFDERKATQAAARFLELRGGTMHYLKLIKLLYLADRTALLQWGYPITTDHYVSMDHGPVTSRIYNLLVDEVEKPFWSEYISAPNDYQVSLLKAAPNDRLSRAEELLISQIFDRFGGMNRWDIVRYLHTLPEWKNPHGTSIPIHIREILEGDGALEKEEIDAILRELRAESLAQEVLEEAV
jgi:uncharacterized phage-associated protein